MYARTPGKGSPFEKFEGQIRGVLADLGPMPAAEDRAEIVIIIIIIIIIIMCSIVIISLYLTY